MASFSERHGYKSVRSIVQHESLDDESRMEVWNLLAVLPRAFGDMYNDSTEHRILEDLWVWHFKEPRDELPFDEYVWRRIKTQVMQGDWNEVLDLREAFAKRWDANETSQSAALKHVFLETLNGRFETMLIGYRLIGLEISPLDSSMEADAVTSAITDVGSIAGARHALNRAVDLLTDRTTPDYPNSIKESISAVESVVKKATGEGQLGAGLTKLEASGLKIHPALKTGWSKLYGWTSNADGMRHAGIEAADADQALAKYMLVTCSAFVSYLVEEGRKRGLLK